MDIGISTEGFSDVFSPLTLNSGEYRVGIPLGFGLDVRVLMMGCCTSLFHQHQLFGRE